jgi:hypothetical protein
LEWMNGEAQRRSAQQARTAPWPPACALYIPIRLQVRQAAAALVPPLAGERARHKLNRSSTPNRPQAPAGRTTQTRRPKHASPHPRKKQKAPPAPGGGWGHFGLPMPVLEKRRGGGREQIALEAYWRSTARG